MKCGNYDRLKSSQNISDYFPFLYVENSGPNIEQVFIVFICIIGLLGNGTVLWFLSSNTKRNPFVFITNLSAADFGVLLALCTNVLLFFGVRAHGPLHHAVYIIHLCLHNVYAFMHYASANFLMIISIDRCTAVLFPIWHRSHRSKTLLATATACLWALSCLMEGLSFFSRFCYNDLTSNVVAFTIIYVLVVLSTGVLLFKVCSTPQLRQRGKLLMAVLISLSFFIITMVPRGVFTDVAKEKETVPSFLLLLKAINSSINPIIYFFVGILKAGPARRTLKATFQKFFKEEAYEAEEGEQSTTMNSTVPPSTTTSYNCALPTVGAFSKPEAV
ncbi:mas-related G-protein coupled receptor member H-like [Heteronotia binoei]|uniref:mas-related G-protein coupled receptor member H-like n=1 Tax=Heteronotia binoei TaxID=13085 RepID=UPI00292D4CCA|nr:mas-related G-protein coupled receptor member H-like [Heteronotia binoei]